MHYAAAKGHKDVVSLLLTRGAYKEETNEVSVVSKIAFMDSIPPPALSLYVYSLVLIIRCIEMPHRMVGHLCILLQKLGRWTSFPVFSNSRALLV